MSKFKIGDIVKATKESNEVYYVTNEKNHFVGKVIEIGYPIRVVNLRTQDRYWVNDEYFELVYPEAENESKDNSCDKEKSGDYLEYCDKAKYLGKIGNPTPYKDNEGNALFVGDVVQVVTQIDGDEFYTVEKVVVIEEDAKQFIWGLYDYCDQETGDLDFEDGTVKKIRSYKDVKNGEVIRGVKYIKENKNDSKRDSKKG